MFKNAQWVRLSRFGKNKWHGHVADVAKQMKAALEAEDVVVGRGNA